MEGGACFVGVARHSRGSTFCFLGDTGLDANRTAFPRFAAIRLGIELDNT